MTQRARAANAAKSQKARLDKLDDAAEQQVCDTVSATSHAAAPVSPHAAAPLQQAAATPPQQAVPPHAATPFQPKVPPKVLSTEELYAKFGIKNRKSALQSQAKKAREEAAAAALVHEPAQHVFPLLPLTPTTPTLVQRANDAVIPFVPFYLDLANSPPPPPPPRLAPAVLFMLVKERMPVAFPFAPVLVLVREDEMEEKEELGLDPVAPHADELAELFQGNESETLSRLPLRMMSIVRLKSIIATLDGFLALRPNLRFEAKLAKLQRLNDTIRLMAVGHYLRGLTRGERMGKSSENVARDLFGIQEKGSSYAKRIWFWGAYFVKHLQLPQSQRGKHSHSLINDAEVQETLKEALRSASQEAKNHSGVHPKAL